jgi:hypothetical protein
LEHEIKQLNDKKIKEEELDTSDKNKLKKLHKRLNKMKERIEKGLNAVDEDDEVIISLTKSDVSKGWAIVGEKAK